MIIDIFQYSDMYTPRKSRPSACEGGLRSQGRYNAVQQPTRARFRITVLSGTTSGRSIPDSPKLLHLCSRMRPGKSVFERAQDHDVRSLSASSRCVRIFPPHSKKQKREPESIILHALQGFLRRVHRWSNLHHRRNPAALQTQTSNASAVSLLQWTAISAPAA
jgi:hypothetical protein